MVATKGVDPGKKLMDAQQETKRLKEKAVAIQQQFTAMMKEKSVVQTDLNDELDVLRAVKDIGSSPSEAAIAKLNAEIQTLEKDTAVSEAEAQGISRCVFFCIQSGFSCGLGPPGEPMPQCLRPQRRCVHFQLPFYSAQFLCGSSVFSP